MMLCLVHAMKCGGGSRAATEAFSLFLDKTLYPIFVLHLGLYCRTRCGSVVAIGITQLIGD